MISATYISRALIGYRHTAEDEGVAVAPGGSARLAHAFEELLHGAVLPLPDEPVPRLDVDGLRLQLEVLRGQEGKERRGSRIKI